MINLRVQQAVAAAIALGAAAGAGAVDITTVPAGNVLYVSGSTAIDPAFSAYLTNQTDKVCDATAGAIDTYTSTNSPDKFIAVACIAGAGAPGAVGDPIAIIKEDNAGSANGITPVNNSSLIHYPVFTSLTAVNCGPASPHTCNTSITDTTHVSNLGFADVEAAIFGLPTNNLSSLSSVDTIFAPAVSLGLYHALQAVQGLSVGVDDVTDMPSLTRSQLAALYNGQITLWTKFADSAGTTNVFAEKVQFGNSHLVGGSPTCWNGTTAFSTGCTTAPAVAAASSGVFICERGQSSGTQNTSQIFYANQGCQPSPKKFLIASKPHSTCTASGCGWSTATYGAVAVFAGKGQPDDLACLEAQDGEGHFAVGFLSTDQPWGTSSTDTDRRDWRFIRVDGVVPSNENAAAGRYEYWAQSAGYFPNSTSAADYPTAGTVAATLEADFTSATTQVGTAASVKAVDANFEWTAPAFDGGVVAIPGNGGATPNASSATQATFRGNPVSVDLRNTPNGNNCDKPYISSLAPDTSDFPTWAGP